jgi:hypothetical protein
MADKKDSVDVDVRLKGAEARAQAGRLNGKTVRRYYSEHPLIGIAVASLAALSIIIGASISGFLGAIVAAVVTVILALLPPLRTKHRDESEW